MEPGGRNFFMLTSPSSPPSENALWRLPSMTPAVPQCSNGSLWNDVQRAIMPRSIGAGGLTLRISLYAVVAVVYSLLYN